MIFDKRKAIKKQHKVGKPCAARAYRRLCDPCGEPADTIRRVQAAPGLWVHAPVCHYHQHLWDEAGEWGGAIVYREDPCPLDHDDDEL